MASNGRGLRLLKAIDVLSKLKPNIFDSRLLEKVKIISISNGVIKGRFTVEPSMCNIGGVIHGGFLASVTDVMAYYAQLSQAGGRIAVTTTLSTNYLAMATEGETLIVETKSLKSGKTPVVETYLYNERGDMLVKATNSFLMASERYQTLLKDVFDIYNDD